MIRASKEDLPSWFVITLFFTCYLWIFLAILHPIQDPAFWWHLASGRDIVWHRRIPAVDVFSLTASGSRWINSYWLYDIVVYLLYTRLGAGTTTILYAFLVLAAFYFVDRRLIENDVHWTLRLASLAVLFYGAAPAGGYWGPQASLVTFFFVSGLLYHLDLWKRKGWTSTLWYWVPLFLLWANLHRGFVLGWCIAGFYVLNDKEPGQARKRWCWLLACAGVTLLTPRPLGLFRMIWDDFSFSPERITGWMLPAIGHLKVFAWTVPGFWALSLRRPSALVRSWPLTLLAVLLTTGSLRHLVYVTYFMIYAVPDMAIRLSALFSQARWAIGTQKREMAAAVAVFALLVVCIRQTRPALGIVWSGVYDFIRNEKIQGPFYNDYILGGQWLWAFAGNPPVFIDGRYPAVEGYKPLAQEIVAATGGPTSWKQFLDRYHIQAALVKYYWDSPRPSVDEAIFPRSTWALVYWDDTDSLFLRRGGPNGKVIAEQQFLEVWPDAKRDYMIQSLRAMSKAERGRLGKELIRNAELHPESHHTAEMISLFLAHHLDK